MKVFHVITTLDVGGAEMHLLSQVRGQCARGHAVRVAYLKGQGSLAQDFRDAGAEWIGSVGGIALPLNLRRHIAWADVVHSHLLKADMATALFATLFGKRRRLISSKHNDEKVLERPLVSFIHGILGNLPARTIVLSDHVGRFFQRHGRLKAARMTRIYYGLDRTPFEAAAGAPSVERETLRESFGFEPEDVVFICVARFAPQKAHDVLLRAFAAARVDIGDDVTLRLLLVGDDPFGDGREKAQALARTLDLLDSKAVTFAGIRRDVPALLAASDVFVMSSLWEGLGLVFLEAMATGLPVLASDVSAIPEVVVHGETGVLVPPADASALAGGFLQLARDAAERKRLAAGGKARVAEVFNLDRMIDDTLECYRQVQAGG